MGFPSSHEDFLKKIKVRDLQPKIQQEVLDFANQIGYEKTIRSNSNLTFLVKIYNQQKAKRNKSKLKKAEKMILKLATMKTKFAERSEEKKKKKESKPKISYSTESSSPLSIPEILRSLFYSVGITDEAVMVNALDIHGSICIKTRIDMSIGILGHDLAKTVFSQDPNLLIEPQIENFASQLREIKENSNAQKIKQETKKLGALTRVFGGAKKRELIERIKKPNIDDLEEAIEELESDIERLYFRKEAVKNEWAMATEEVEFLEDGEKQASHEKIALESFNGRISSFGFDDLEFEESPEGPILRFEDQQFAEPFATNLEFAELQEILGVEEKELIALLKTHGGREKLLKKLELKLEQLSSVIDEFHRAESIMVNLSIEHQKYGRELEEAQKELKHLQGQRQRI